MKLYLLLLAFLTMLVYSNTLKVPFYFDDEASIVTNTAIRKFDLATIYKYQPSRVIPYLTFAINYRLAHLDVVSFHLTNIALHICATCLVFLLVKKLVGLAGVHSSYLFSLVVAALFALHPLQTQAVTYTVQRATILAGLFYLSSMVFYLYWRTGKSKSALIFSLISAGFAFLSKENTYTLPISILLVELLALSINNKSVKKRSFTFLGFFVIAAVFYSLIVRPYASGFEMSQRQSTQEESRYSGEEAKAVSRKDYFFTQINVVRTYLGLLTLPLRQNFDYDYPIYSSIANKQTMLSLGLHISLLVVAFFVMKRRPLFSFGVFFFYLTLAIESSVIPVADVIFEHRLYLPSVGFFIAVVSLLWDFKKRFPIAFTTFVVAWLVALGLLSYRRNLVWANPVSFWSDNVSKSPNKGRPHLRLAIAYSDVGNLDNAIAEYQKIIALAPNYVRAYNNLGLIYFSQNRLKEAEDIFLRAISINPDYLLAYYNLAAVYNKLEKFDLAEAQFRKAKTFGIPDAKAHFGLGFVYLGKNDLRKAKLEFEKAIELDPNTRFANSLLGKIYLSEGNLEKAKFHYQKAIELDPTDDLSRRTLKSIN